VSVDSTQFGISNPSPSSSCDGEDTETGYPTEPTESYATTTAAETTTSAKATYSTEYPVANSTIVKPTRSTVAQTTLYEVEPTATETDEAPTSTFTGAAGQMALNVGGLVGAAFAAALAL
jgi:hypothetical protein